MTSFECVKMKLSILNQNFTAMLTGDESFFYFFLKLYRNPSTFITYLKLFDSKLF